MGFMVYCIMGNAGFISSTVLEHLFAITVLADIKVSWCPFLRVVGCRQAVLDGGDLGYTMPVLFHGDGACTQRKQLLELVYIVRGTWPSAVDACGSI